MLPPLQIGDHIYLSKRWEQTDTVVEVGQFHQYVVKVTESNRLTLRNRQRHRKFTPSYSSDIEGLIESFLPSLLEQKRVSPDEPPQHTIAPATAEMPPNTANNGMPYASGKASPTTVEPVVVERTSTGRPIMSGTAEPVVVERPPTSGPTGNTLDQLLTPHHRRQGRSCPEHWLDCCLTMTQARVKPYRCADGAIGATKPSERVQ